MLNFLRKVDNPAGSGYAEKRMQKEDGKIYWLENADVLQVTDGDGNDVTQQFGWLKKLYH